jgi:SAM-dependent methyltransferase
MSAKLKRKSAGVVRGAGEHYLDAELYEYEYRRRRDDVNYYAACASGELPPDSEILELCCGSGRVTRKLLRSGFHVTGIDMSEQMLVRARSGVARLPKRFRDNAEFQVGDMRDFHLGKRFPLIVMAFNSFEHLYNRKDIERCLRCIREHLQPDGLFAFDVQLPQLAWLIKDSKKRWARTKFRHPITKQQLAYSTNHVYDPVTQIAMIRLYYQPLSTGPIKQTVTVKLSQRKFFPAELQALLHYSGFEVIRHYGDFAGEKLDEFAESQVLLCRLATQIS